MKNFPKFSDAEIQFTMSQPQAKLLIACMSFFTEGMEADVPTNLENTSEMLKLLHEHVKHRLGFSLPNKYLKQPAEFKTDVENLLIEQLQDVFYLKQCEFVDLFKKQVNELAAGLDPEIFNLRDGESIELAYQGSITCSPAVKGTSDASDLVTGKEASNVH